MKKAKYNGTIYDVIMAHYRDGWAILCPENCGMKGGFRVLINETDL